MAKIIYRFLGNGNGNKKGSEFFHEIIAAPAAHINRVHTWTPGWNDVTDPALWDGFNMTSQYIADVLHEFPIGQWNGSVLDSYQYPDGPSSEIWPHTAVATGNFWDGFRPTKVRLTYTGDVPALDMELWIYSPEPRENFGYLDTNNDGYASLQELDLDWSSCNLNIGGLDIWTNNTNTHIPFVVTKIEFYYDPSFVVNVPLRVINTTCTDQQSPIILSFNDMIDPSTAINGTTVLFTVTSEQIPTEVPMSITVSPTNTDINLFPPSYGWPSSGHITLTTGLNNSKGVGPSAPMIIQNPFANLFYITGSPNSVTPTQPVLYTFSTPIDGTTVLLGSTVIVTDAGTGVELPITADVNGNYLTLSPPSGGWQSTFFVRFGLMMMDIYGSLFDNQSSFQITVAPSQWADVTNQFTAGAGFDAYDPAVGFVYNPSTVTDIGGFGTLTPTVPIYQSGYHYWRFSFTENGVTPVGDAAYANMRDGNGNLLMSGWIPSGQYAPNGALNIFGLSTPNGWATLNMKSSIDGTTFIVTKIEINVVTNDMNVLPIN